MASLTPNGWRCCSTMKRLGVTTGAWRFVFVRRSCVIMPCPRMSTTAPPWARPPLVRHAAQGRLDQKAMRTAPLSGRPASGKAGLAVHLVTRPAGTTTLYFTPGCRGCSKNWTLPGGDGRLTSRMKSIAAVELLILDDWGLQAIDANARHYLLEMLEDRYSRRSTLVTSQLPIAKWHELINDPTYADAILDRLLQNANRLELNGDSMRRPPVLARP